MTRLCGYHGAATPTSSRAIFEQAGTTFPPRQAGLVAVGAGSLDVTRLLALVANLLATSGLLGAVAGVVASPAAVVATHAVDTLAYAVN